MHIGALHNASVKLKWCATNTFQRTIVEILGKAETFSPETLTIAIQIQTYKN